MSAFRHLATDVCSVRAGGSPGNGDRSTDRLGVDAIRRLLVLVAVLTALLAGCSLPATQPGSGTPTTAAAASPSPKLITVPNVVGHNADVALDELKRAGFNNVDLGTVDGHKFVALPQNWTVKTQSAKAGELLPGNAKIVLGCARNG